MPVTADDAASIANTSTGTGTGFGQRVR